LFDFAWLFGVRLFIYDCHPCLNGFLRQFVVASFVYYTTSILFPAFETMLDAAIFDDTKDDNHSNGSRTGSIRQHEKAAMKRTETSVHV
jgi:hypothetical protein